MKNIKPFEKYAPIIEKYSNIYSKIFAFCSVKNKFGAHKNGTEEVPNRVKFILNLLEFKGIEYTLDRFEHSDYKDNYFYNIIMKGSSNKWVMAHHDVVNVKSENANDNSCSVINAIALKLLKPSINVIITDGEEPPCMGVGSSRFGEQIKSKIFNPKWVLNLELTGRGGENFFVSDSNTSLTNGIVNLFNCKKIQTPFNDSDILKRYGVDTCNINPCPLKENGDFDLSILWLCHSMEDNTSKISVEDMQAFTENVLLEIVNKL